MTPESWLDSYPMVAILRGLRPAKAVETGQALFDQGVRVMEVPLNSPDPMASIAHLAKAFGGDSLIGAGTVLTPDQVDEIHKCGGQLIVAPNTHSDVIARALHHGMAVMPGVGTATEALAAVGAGARRLKLFPASTFGPGHLKALRDVLPPEVKIYPVGGVGAESLEDWASAGAAGFGFGSDIFKPDRDIADIAQRAGRLSAAVDRALAR